MKKMLFFLELVNCVSDQAFLAPIAVRKKALACHTVLANACCMMVDQKKTEKM